MVDKNIDKASGDIKNGGIFSKATDRASALMGTFQWQQKAVFQWFDKTPWQISYKSQIQEFSFPTSKEFPGCQSGNHSQFTGMKYGKVYGNNDSVTKAKVRK